MIAEVLAHDLALTRGERRLFSGLSFVVRAGEALALTGANGAGKTSLLRAIAGFLAPAAGAITFHGEAGLLESEDARRAHVHLLGHQDGLKSGRRAGDELSFLSLWTGADRAGIEAAVEALELRRVLSLEVRKLSAGQRRRLALARLIASPRALWLLDEPLAPLDTRHRAGFGALMRRHLEAGGLIVAAVHDPLPVEARVVELSP